MTAFGVCLGVILFIFTYTVGLHLFDKTSKTPVASKNVDDLSITKVVYGSGKVEYQISQNLGGGFSYNLNVCESEEKAREYLTALRKLREDNKVVSREELK